jgi:hypothetical protein
MFQEKVKNLRENFGSPLLFAIQYARMGLPVLPIYSLNSSSRCACGKVTCEAPGKHPISELVPNGLNNSSTDLDQIEEWFTKIPNANIAIRTGVVSNLTVIDFDLKSNGLETYKQHFEKNPIFSRVLKASSGGGGFHCFFKYNSSLKSKNSILTGVDCKNDGGYIIVEPSVHVSGGKYLWRI